MDLRETHPKSLLSNFSLIFSLSFYLLTSGIFSICLLFLGIGAGGMLAVVVVCYVFFDCLLVLAMLSAISQINIFSSRE